MNERGLEAIAATSLALKVFPLPSVVLLPSTRIPLHIFEERYRRLIRTAWETDKVLALAQLQPGWEPDYLGRPPIKPIACAGIITWHQTLPDGKSNILVEGLTRVRILEELPPQAPYREVRADVLADAPFAGAEEEQLRRAVLEWASRFPSVETGEVLSMAARLQGGTLADAVASRVVGDVDDRQALLEELDVGRRLRRVIDELGEQIGRIGPTREEGVLN